MTLEWGGRQFYSAPDSDASLHLSFSFTTLTVGGHHLTDGGGAHLCHRPLLQDVEFGVLAIIQPAAQCDFAGQPIRADPL
jgi:hypothetical protein